MSYEFIPLLPFAAFLILGLFGHWIKDRAHLVAVPAVIVSFILSVITFIEVAGGRHTTIPLYTWATSGELSIELSLYVDRLTAVMLLLVTIVSSLVHVYTIGYMRGDRGYARFFAYIALFTFSMLMLVMADNLLQLFIFWEAVGLCSYLLIGHWYERPAACSAATKAFIVNRVGDFGFMLGLLLVWYSFGSLDYHEMFARVHDAAGMYHLLTHGAFKALLFLGCGSVIIALHHEQDMRRMGGLKDKLPVTYWTFVVGSLALAGFPLTSGFFSKDNLLVSAWSAGLLGQFLTVLGLVTALMTAFYSFRLV